MSLSSLVNALATRVGQEIKAVRAEVVSALAGKASTSHTHATYAPLDSPTFTGLVTATRVARTPFTLTYASTLTPSGDDGDYQRCTLTGATTLATPTGGYDSQLLLVEFTASGGSRNVLLTSLTRLSVVPSSLAIPDGQRGWVGLVRTGSSWFVLAADLLA